MRSMTFKIVLLIIPLTISANIGVLPSDPCCHDNKIPTYSLDSGPHYSTVPISSSSSSSYQGPVQVQDYFYCDRYGPFEADNCSDFTASFTYELNGVADQSIIERIRLFNSSNSVVASSSKAASNYVKGTRKTISFVVPIKNYWSSSGLTLKFEILNSQTRVIIKAFSVTFFPPRKQTHNGVILKRETYTSNSLGFYGDGEGLKELKETFDFTTIGDYIGVDYYYRLDLSNNYFKYPNSYPLSFESINLRFNDSNNLFPYYTHQLNNDIVIPLALDKSGDIVRFKFKNKFYINKRTLQISDTYRTNFTSTEDFYLPINGKRLFNEKQIYFDINYLGLDQISASIPVKYDISRSLVGVCTDGNYCVVGGNR